MGYVMSSRASPPPYLASTRAGRRSRLGDTASYPCAIWNKRASSNGRPISCSPMGSPADVNPQGIDMAGNPVALLGLVHLAVIPAPAPLTGYVVPCRTTVSVSIRQAATGAAGVTSTSTSWRTRAYSSLIRRWTFSALE